MPPSSRRPRSNVDEPGHPISLTARSVIATALLGAARPARLPVSALVQAGTLFGIGDSAIRTALSRMVAAGELEADDGRYRLAGRLREREQRVDESYLPRRRDWDGTWELAIVRAERRLATARHTLRAAATALRFAELREGVWARPNNLDRDRLPLQQATLDAQCVRLFGATAPAGLAGDLFDLAGWADHARTLLNEVRGGFDEEPNATADALAAGFRLSIAVTRHLQSDPLLPDELLPARWPGPDLRREYSAHDQRFKRALARALTPESRA